MAVPLRVHNCYYLGEYLVVVEYCQFSLYKLSELYNDEGDTMSYSSKFDNMIINYANCDRKDPSNLSCSYIRSWGFGLTEVYLFEFKVQSELVYTMPAIRLSNTLKVDKLCTLPGF
jgi:hypothetical protein